MILSILISFIFLRFIIIILSSAAFLLQYKNKFYKNSELSVSVVIPIHCEENSVIDSLELLLDTDKKINKEVIAVINGDKPGTRFSEELKDLSLKRNNLRVFYIKESNKPLALNKGIKESSGKIILLADIDTQWEEGAISRIISGFADPLIGAVAGQVIPRVTKSFLNDCQLTEYSGFYLDRLASSFWRGASVPGAFGAFRREVFDCQEPFRPDIEGEDFYNSLNLLEKGYGIICDPKVLLYSRRAPEDLKNLVGQRNRWYGGIGEAFCGYIKSSFLRKAPLLKRIKPFWHLFNIQLFYYIVASGEIIFLLYAFLSGDFALFLLWKFTLFFQLALYFIYARFIIRSKASLPGLFSIIFYITVYFYLLIGVRIISQFLNLFGYRFQRNRAYLYKF